MVYAKFLSKKALIPFSGKVLSLGGFTVVNPTENQLKMAGYLPCMGSLAFSPTPPDGHYYATDGKIITCYKVEEHK